ncbi:Uncharacterized protein TCM_013493 [Theobroma cacao]|uniref:Uncharacterized protein n=1 Tax=Theobroma cacao TaxID=3641 RepID=A0A061G3K6_THECC|nr:Uncharacterized protein TCM_013493 [Theobroma cacao]
MVHYDVAQNFNYEIVFATSGIRLHVMDLYRLCEHLDPMMLRSRYVCRGRAQNCEKCFSLMFHFGMSNYQGRVLDKGKQRLNCASDA